MLNIRACTSSVAAQKYYTANSHAGDYTAGPEIAGMRGGQLAERLGLEGAVGHKEFNRLCEGCGPESSERYSRDMRRGEAARGVRLHVQRSQKRLARLGMDRDKAIMAALHDSVRETMQEAETAMSVRVSSRI